MVLKSTSSKKSVKKLRKYKHNKKTKQNKALRKKGGTITKLPNAVVKFNIAKYLNETDKSLLRNTSKSLANILTEDFEEDDILIYITEQLSWLNQTETVSSQQKYIKNATARISLYIKYEEELHQDNQTWLIYITSDGHYAYNLIDGVYTIQEFNDATYKNKIGSAFETLHIKGVTSKGDPLANIHNAIDLLKNELHKSNVQLDHVEISFSNLDFMKQFN